MKGSRLRRAAAARNAAEAQSEFEALIACLRFSPSEGRIWFDNQAVALVRTSSLAALHQELVETLGQREAGSFLASLGFASGLRDAQLARKLRDADDIAAMMQLGPRLRAIRGIVSMRPVKQELDLKAGHFYSEAIFTGDFEADSRLANDGMAHGPVCWMQVGFAAGFASALLGRPAVYKEVECRATGSRHCRIVGKLLEEWHADEIEAELRCVPPEVLGKRRAAPPRPRSTTAVVVPRQPEDDLAFGIVGRSPALKAAWSKIRTVAETSATVLFLGETGVGKGVLARALHQASRRHAGPFVSLNCAAIPDNLIEAELFGVEKGAYTGASQSRPGRFERADGGTLFLDEISSLSLPAQLKLLRAIQDKEIERVGGAATRRVDVRILAATNERLQDAVAQGRFREDLLFRLNVFPVRIPPLRERREDIPLLLQAFLDRYNKRHRKRITGFAEAAFAAFNRYHYPGNIRELENLVERAVILAEDDEAIDLAHLFGVEGLTPLAAGEAAAEARPAAASNPLFAALVDAMTVDGLPLKEVEHRLLRLAMTHADGNVAQAARLLGMTRPQFSYRLERLRAAERL